MRIKDFYLNLSIKYKLVIFFNSIILPVSLILGLYSYSISEKNVIKNVSAANLEVIKQINSNLNFMQADITDISTYICIDSTVESTLNSDYNTIKSSMENQLHINNSLKFIMNVIASKSYISMVILYGNNGFGPYDISTDTSSGVNDFESVQKSEIYKTASALNGSPLWVSVPQGSQVFLQNNKNFKVALCRVIKNHDMNINTGFLVIGINEQYIRNMCCRSLQRDKESLLILDKAGNTVSKIGNNSNELLRKVNYLTIEWKKQKEGFLIDNITDKDYLITYSNINNLGWKIFYSVPKDTLTKEINSIKLVTLGIILVCIFFTLPLTVLISTFFTAPLRKLFKSMKNFQNGNFEERVRFKYKDEIGELGEGYNNMVSNIKDLIDKAYILQIREREAELNALQAQINPHFLYNTLDTIFWKAERQGQKEISDIVFSLSRLFRLSLNRGKGSTPVSREKELVEHYLSLQKIRFKSKLNYEINIEDNILDFMVPKLLLQPFVENAILHGIEGRENGGTIRVSGILYHDKLFFSIEDDGIGMTEEKLRELLDPVKDDDVNTPAVSGGYAVRNVNERLRLNYGDNYSLNFTSVPGQGTRVEINIPAYGCGDNEEVRQ